MTRARHYAEAFALAVLVTLLAHGADRLAVWFRRYDVDDATVDELAARLNVWRPA